AAGLDLPPAHGSFQIHITQLSTGQRLTYTVNVDLDGINPAGDTTLTSLAADLDAISDITASATSDGRLQISADTNDFQISFSDDTSGVLAALGINTFFTGTSARDIGVNSVVAQDVTLLAAGRGHAVGDNQAALAIAALRQTGVDELGGMSLPQYWSRHVEDLAAKLSATRQQVDADTVVFENLQAQQQAISGVNIDEEAIDLVRYQQAYQASARFLSVVDELMRTLLAMV
ncbi:MAG: flagellar hook-associated protein FlgK, partial [Phycisphaerae bacterium]